MFLRRCRSLSLSLKELLHHRSFLLLPALTLMTTAALGVTGLYSHFRASARTHTAVASTGLTSDSRQVQSFRRSIRSAPVVTVTDNPFAPVTVSAASYDASAIAPDSIVAAFG